jgi:hypothetical protein
MSFIKFSNSFEKGLKLFAAFLIFINETFFEKFIFKVCANASADNSQEFYDILATILRRERQITYDTNLGSLTERKGSVRLSSLY